MKIPRTKLLSYPMYNNNINQQPTINQKKSQSPTTPNSIFSLPKSWDETKERMARGAKIGFMVG